MECQLTGNFCFPFPPFRFFLATSSFLLSFLFFCFFFSLLSLPPSHFPLLLSPLSFPLLFSPPPLSSFLSLPSLLPLSPPPLILRSAYVLFVVGDGERNVFDQRPLEFELWKRYTK